MRRMRGFALLSECEPVQTDRLLTIQSGLKSRIAFASMFRTITEIVTDNVSLKHGHVVLG